MIIVNVLCFKFKFKTFIHNDVLDIFSFFEVNNNYNNNNYNNNNYNNNNYNNNNYNHDYNNNNNNNNHYNYNNKKKKISYFVVKRGLDKHYNNNYNNTNHSNSIHFTI